MTTVSYGRVLLFGPSFAGKTYLSERLRALGVNAVDSDAWVGLSYWCDRAGVVVEPPRGFGLDFVLAHRFLWDRDFLARELDSAANVVVLGYSGNVFDCFDLFDRVYFLDLDEADLERRFLSNERKNPFGQTAEQQEIVRGGHRLVREQALGWGVPFLDAAAAAEEIAAALDLGERAGLRLPLSRPGLSTA